MRSMLSGIRRLGAGHAPLRRFRVGLEYAIGGHREVEDMIAVHAGLARELATQLELPAPILDAVGASYERWDGRGWPGKLAGAAIPLAARIAQLAEHAEVAHRMGGIAGVTSLAREREGAQFDPSLTKLLWAKAPQIFGGLDAIGTWSAVIDAEPALRIELSEAGFDAALSAIANFVDLKSPYMLGHSRALADLCAAAGAILGVTGHELDALRRSGLVQGYGRLGVSNAIWDKPGPLGTGERERVRMHPYLTERMLQQSSALAPLGEIVLQHRERLDGSGYPRGVSGTSIGRAARILGAADAYLALREPRPHRAARTSDEAAQVLRTEVRAGRFDADAAEAVLSAAGHRARRRREGPAGLTPREIEVLRLLARGLSTKQIAAELALSPKTAGNHIEHIYAKIETTSRAAASLFAVRHGLLEQDGW
jgi:HD-GYP domain-containing protein (c-di-GMP phosphodiesterase class II)